MSPINFQDGARFTCRSCGHCCRGWAIPVDEATVTRLRTHNWGADPFEQRATAGRPYRIRLVAGHCFFLDEENQCRIHKELSYESKPEACRAFPLSVLDVGGRSYGRLSFWCPTVVENAGKPLEHQLRWVRETARHADQRTASITIGAGRALAASEFEPIHQALRSLITRAGLPFADRLAAACALLQRLARADQDRASLDRVLRAATAEGAAVLAREARKGGKAGGGRRVLAFYLLEDFRGGRFSKLARFGAVLLFSAGLTRLGSAAIDASASWRQVRRVSFDLSPTGESLLTRYLSSKIDARRYLAGDVSAIDGFNLLTAAYGIVNLLARMRAAAAGRLTCDDDDVREAVRAADFLVLEHQERAAGSRQQAIRAAMSGDSLCGDLLACLEGK